MQIYFEKMQKKWQKKFYKEIKKKKKDLILFRIINLDDVLCDIEFEHIPEPLMKRFDNEK